MVAWTRTVIPVEIILNNVLAFNITTLGLPLTSIHVERERRIFLFPRWYNRDERLSV